MVPLSIQCQNYGTPEANSANISSALDRGLPEFAPALCANDGTFVVAGSGHSLPSSVDEIRAERALGRPICAAKGAHDFLCEAGIPPDLFICVDPRDRRENIKYANDQTIYLMASRCDPVMFDHLKARKVVVWHSYGSMEEAQVYKDRSKAIYGGGSTSGIRAITLGYMMGFRKFVLYGMDSCLAPDRKTKRFTGEEAGSTFEVQVGDSGPRFWCNGALAQQANEFQELFPTFPGIQIEAKGDGLLAEIIRQRA
jgi:uncharacterized Rossmann fold enzyme